MLQPRLSAGKTVGKCASARSVKMSGDFVRLAWIAAVVLVANASVVICQDIENHSNIEGSRIKRESVPENRDLTVLLLNDQKKSGDFNTKIGRYHSVKPLIGLLTSTARTFIQDGVTTEYATQILGTTLDNGRIYAQLLTKSSLVLYNKPNIEDFDVKPTRIHSAFDGEWNVKQDLGIIDPDKFILKNTDYINPTSKMAIVYASKPAADSVKHWNMNTNVDIKTQNHVEEPTGRRVQQYKEIPRFSENDVLNQLDEPLERNPEVVIKPSIIDSVNAIHRKSKAHVAPEYVPFERIKEEANNITKISKVKPDLDLPTFTIKNELSPLFYYIDNLESKGHPQVQAQPSKAPKKLFGQKHDSKPKKTFTYAGFADFTTVVGDTVIIFTPNTEVNRDSINGNVDVVPSAKSVDKLATKITFLSADIPVPTATLKANIVNAASKMPKPLKSRDETRSDKALYNDDESLKKVLYEVDRMPDAVSVQYNNGFDFNMDVIQPSEATLMTTDNTRFTDDLEVIPIENYNSKATDPLITLSPSSTYFEMAQDTSVTEANHITTTDSEEVWNGSEEVTEYQDEIHSTTEYNSEETTEEMENQSVGNFEDSDSHETTCTHGIHPVSTMTTAYQTLTYLTTYFIPLDGKEDETTTSVNSNIVIESKVGYLTNYECKSENIIKPTSVVKQIEHTILGTEEKGEDMEEIEVSTEGKTLGTTQSELDQISNSITTMAEETEPEVIIKKYHHNLTENATSDPSVKTTTEHSSTSSKSHVEMTVTEKTQETTTEKNTTPMNKETLNEEDWNNTENEIDLIYKTLYTTYTYFTTYFKSSSSSIESHKSVVTNIVTSTLDLSQMDPSLLGALTAGDIAPTSVGIGRPTEAIHSVIDLFKNKDVIESVESDRDYNSQTPTPSLSDETIKSINPDVVKTYFTTYTFFTTIYVGNDANICSRSEIYTNYVGPDELLPTKSNALDIVSTKTGFDFRNCKQMKQSDMTTTSTTESSENTDIDPNRSNENLKKYQSYSSITRQHNQDVPTQPSPVEVDMLFSVESNPLESENVYVTDVKSSYSKGEKKFLDNNNLFDDQISSESNIEEIVPSPTLLLQTSYTTFTYFTTMYIGKDSSKIKSRLETITNVVTETLAPKKHEEVEENNLPITYYTTFTYWTTLYKDKSTTITSREEIISNIVTPLPQNVATVSPIDTTPIDIESVVPGKDLEVEIKPSILSDGLDQDDEKATFYTTYTYFTTFYVSNTSEIRSSLETVTNIVDNTKDPISDNQLARSIGKAPAKQNLVNDAGDKPVIEATIMKEQIKPTKLAEIPALLPTVLSGTYIDNLFAEIKPVIPKEQIKENTEKKILYSQVAVISGGSNIVTSDNKTLQNYSSTTTTETSSNLLTPNPEVIESSVSEPTTTAESKPGNESEEEDDGENTRTRSRLTFQPKKPTFTPVIRPFASRNRPTFSPKRVAVTNSALTITRSDFTPTITATPTLKSIKSSGFGANRKQSSSSFLPGSSSPGRRFSGRSSASASFNSPSVIRSSGSGFRNRQEIQPTSKRTGFRSSSLRSNTIDYVSRSSARIRPTASSRLRAGRQSASVTLPPVDDSIVNESETQQEYESSSEVSQGTSESPAVKTTNTLSRFRRPLARIPGTAVTPRATTPVTTRKGSLNGRGRATTSTQRPTTRSTSNPLFTLRSRQRPNALFPRRGLFKQPDPQEEEENNNQQKVEGVQEEELAESEDFEEDNDYESSDRREQQVSTTTSTAAPKKNPNSVQIRPFGFKRRTKRQIDYGSRKYSNFRRPSSRNTGINRRVDPEPETEAPTTQRQRTTNRFSSRGNYATTKQPTTATSLRSSRQPFILRGESRTSAPTTSAPSYRARNSRPSSRTTTSASRPKAPRLQTYNSQTERSRSNSRSSGRSRSSASRPRGISRQRTGNDYGSDMKNFYQPVSDGKITVTHHIPTQVTIPIVNGKITEYKNVLTAKPSIEVLLPHQYSTTLGPLGNQQLVLLSDSTALGENGATKVIKYVLHETPTSGIVFTPTTIRGRKTSYSHLVPSTVYNVEYITSTLAPEINANVPLANLLLSQLLLGNPQQQQINPLLALQGAIPQQPVAQTPVTELKTKTTTYVTTVTDARETVLPITFRGKEILTTIVDPTINVITATEFITETIVSTPTIFAPQGQQLNSLLLPFLLQQQQQQQQQQQALALQSPNPLLSQAQPDLKLLQNINPALSDDIYNLSPKPNVLDITSNEEYAEYSQETSSEDLRDEPPPAPKPIRNKPRPPKPSPPKVTSVVTLYVSGRTPGEFSTVLSTVVTDDTQTIRKREAFFFDRVDLVASDLPSLEEVYSSQSDNVLENSLGLVDKLNNDFIENKHETQSLESILGEVSSQINFDASPTYVVK